MYLWYKWFKTDKCIIEIWTERGDDEKTVGYFSHQIKDFRMVYK